VTEKECAACQKNRKGVYATPFGADHHHARIAELERKERGISQMLADALEANHRSQQERDSARAVIRSVIADFEINGSLPNYALNRLRRVLDSSESPPRAEAEQGTGTATRDAREETPVNRSVHTPISPKATKRGGPSIAELEWERDLWNEAANDRAKERDSAREELGNMKTVEIPILEDKLDEARAALTFIRDQFPSVWEHEEFAPFRRVLDSKADPPKREEAK